MRPSIGSQLVREVVCVAALVVVLAEPPHPENRLSPARLTTSSRSKYRRLRFLKPRKQSATAKVAAGNSGRESWRTAAVVALVLTESVVVADWPATTVTGFGVKVQESPLGKPLQAKETVPANEFWELTVNWVIPTVPGWTDSVDSEKLKVKFGISPAGLTMKLCKTDGAAA